MASSWCPAPGDCQALPCCFWHPGCIVSGSVPGLCWGPQCTCPLLLALLSLLWDVPLILVSSGSCNNIEKGTASKGVLEPRDPGRAADNHGLAIRAEFDGQLDRFTLIQPGGSNCEVGVSSALSQFSKQPIQACEQQLAARERSRGSAAFNDSPLGRTLETRSPGGGAGSPRHAQHRVCHLPMLLTSWSSFARQGQGSCSRQGHSRLAGPGPARSAEAICHTISLYPRTWKEKLLCLPCRERDRGCGAALLGGGAQTRWP